jgi:hypothetical protein
MTALPPYFTDSLAAVKGLVRQATDPIVVGQYYLGDGGKFILATLLGSCHSDRATRLVLEP